MCSQLGILAPEYAPMQRIVAHPIDEFCRLFDVPDGEVAALACLKCADVVPPQRTRGISRHAQQAFLHRKPKTGRAHVHAEKNGGQGRCSGIAIRCDSDWHLVFAKKVDWRKFGFAQKIECAWQEDGDRSRVSQGLYAAFIRMFQMIGRYCAVSRRQCRALRVRQLVGVKLHLQSVSPCSPENLCRMRRRERDVFAEYVDSI